jgi:hypothetical protein
MNYLIYILFISLLLFNCNGQERITESELDIIERIKASSEFLSYKIKKRELLRCFEYQDKKSKRYTANVFFILLNNSVSRDKRIDSVKNKYGILILPRFWETEKKQSELYKSLFTRFPEINTLSKPASENLFSVD